MAEPRLRARSRGFSLVEMVIAVAFVSILMAGLATVFKASLSTFYTSGEKMSSIRRNRMSVDLLANDLDAACMYLVNLAGPPTFGATNPPFCILPNMLSSDGSNAAGTMCDELYMYLDQAPAFDGVLNQVPTQRSNAQLVAAGPTAMTAADSTYTIECGTALNAAQVVAGMSIIFKDAWSIEAITSVTPVNGVATNSAVTVVTGPSPLAGILGLGATAFNQFTHIQFSQVVFVQPAQLIKFSVQLLKLDPSAGAPLVPCLVRDQGSYSAQAGKYAGFVTNQNQQLVAENVQGFKVYLSVSSPSAATPTVAQAWAGSDLATTTTGYDSGWTNGILSVDANSLDTQVGTVAPNAKLPSANPNWFRSVPTLVRVDLTTRTALKRQEYSTDNNSLAYKTQTQSLVFVPRHSGLPLDWD